MTNRYRQSVLDIGAQSARTILFIVICVCVVRVPASSQQVDVAAKLRLAQSFEQSGEWEKAASIYESLLEDNQNGFVVLDGLRRSYTEMKAYDKAIHLVRVQLEAKPSDENLLSTLGGLFDLSGQTQAADSIWHVVISRDRQNANLYRLVASQLIDHREYERAIQIYLEGRDATNNQMLFLEELASLYGALHQFEAVAREYVKLIRNNPQQVTYVESRLAAYTGRDEARKGALIAVEEEARRTPDQIPILSLLAWLYMDGKNFDAAFEQYRDIDRLAKANGQEMFQFAQRAAQEGAYMISARAFRAVVESGARKEILPLSRLGYARDIEELSSENDTIAREISQPSVEEAEGTARVSESRPTFQGALALYQQLVRDYPATSIGMQALFRIGVIRFQRMFDLNGAAAAFDSVRRMPYDAALIYEATMSLGEIHVARNDLAQAHREYALLLRSSPEQFRDRILYRIAELNYFEAKFDSAAGSLQRLAANLSNDLANDALQLLYFIQENKAAGQEALAEFARADLLVRQRKYSEALAQFESVARRFVSTPLIDDAMMRIGNMQLKLNRPDSALVVYGKIVHDMPTSILRDRAQMSIGEVYETRLKDKARAITAYEAVLANYPSSLFIEEARKRIRRLRGDAI